MPLNDVRVHAGAMRTPPAGTDPFVRHEQSGKRSESKEGREADVLAPSLVRQEQRDACEHESNTDEEAAGARPRPYRVMRRDGDSRCEAQPGYQDRDAPRDMAEEPHQRILTHFREISSSTFGRCPFRHETTSLHTGWSVDAYWIRSSTGTRPNSVTSTSPMLRLTTLIRGSTVRGLPAGTTLAGLPLMVVR